MIEGSEHLNAVLEITVCFKKHRLENTRKNHHKTRKEPGLYNSKFSFLLSIYFSSNHFQLLIFFIYFAESNILNRRQTVCFGGPSPMKQRCSDEYHDAILDDGAEEKGSDDTSAPPQSNPMNIQLEWKEPR